ncbi:2-oxo acid dehydrogenase subunit E2 [Emcibacter sp.]|uniref:2-oxo acid dehydrogenase subunit E2 n=1 Tax=Emcibacter sp. TaxID=1979954 RepID=UPI003A93B6BC
MATARKLTGVRAFLARKMRQSLQQTAQLTFMGEFDATAVLAARASFKKQGLPASVEDMIIRELAQTVREFPLFNSCWDGEGLKEEDTINVSIAIDTDNGLMAPALFDVEVMDLQDMAEKRRELVDRARKNQLSVTEQTGGTITVSNLGMTRVRFFTPILNFPQVALLGIGMVDRRAVFSSNGELIEKPFIGLSLTVDHAVIDGAPAGRFLTRLCERLEHMDLSDGKE